MSDSPVMSLMLKLASIQKKIDEARKSRPDNWLRIVRLQYLRLRLADRLNHFHEVAQFLAVPRQEMRAIPVYVATNHRNKRDR